MNSRKDTLASWYKNYRDSTSTRKVQNLGVSTGFQYWVLQETQKKRLSAHWDSTTVKIRYWSLRENPVRWFTAIPSAHCVRAYVTRYEDLSRAPVSVTFWRLYVFRVTDSSQ